MNDEIHENAIEIFKKFDKGIIHINIIKLIKNQEYQEWTRLDIDPDAEILSDNVLVESAFAILKVRLRYK